MIDFAVNTANQCLVPQGIIKSHWDGLTGAERFYLKLLELEAKNIKTVDNYQNFAKAFKVADFRPLMASQKANQARLKSAVEFGKNEMSEGSMFYQSTLRAVLFAIYELSRDLNGEDVVRHLALNVPDYYQNEKQRGLAIELSDYLAKKLEALRPEEASHARVLRQLVKDHRLG
jgi:putative DNA methylase